LAEKRRKSRHKMTKPLREKGKVSIRSYFATFKEGEKVLIKLNPSYSEGSFHTRFNGKPGIVKDKKGKCYEVTIRDMNKDKNLIVHPVHMKRY
jgi:large subunit ribosomal protein L21e